MVRIRILLTNLPRMLQDVLERVLADQDDMELVGYVADPIEVLLIATAREIEVVILGVEDGLPGVASHLLEERPQLKILAVSPDGRRAFLYHLQPYMVPIGELSPDGLVDAIRAAVGSRSPGGRSGGEAEGEV